MTTLAQRAARSPRNMYAATSLRSWHSMLHGNNITLNTNLFMTGSGTPPVITQSGTPKRLLDLRVEVNDVSGGTARGQAKFRWFEDGGTTPVESGKLTAATYNLVHPTFGDTGLQLQFPAGTYAADHVGIGKVLQWNDRSLRGNHYVGVTLDGSNLPKLARNATTGRWAVRFTKALNTYLRIANSAYCTELVGGDDTPVTIFTVAGVWGTVGTQHVFCNICHPTIGTSELGIFAHSDSKWGVSKRGEVGSEIFITNGTVDNTLVHVFEHVQFGTTVALWVDGTQVIGTGGAGVAQDCQSLTVTEAILGGIRSGANVYGDVDIYAQAAYVGALSATDRGFIRQMFKQRYGTP